MKDKIYPAIYKSTKNDTYLCASATEQHSMDIGVWIGGDYPDHESDTNITREYLQNTYGEVQSPEHAEFIIELAGGAGLEVYIDSPEINRAFFTFNEDSRLFFYDSEDDINKDRCKQITIPLSPKVETLKNAGDNLILGCEDSKCDEWPCVGDEVMLRYKFDSKQIMHTGKLLYLSDNNIIIATGKNSDYHCHRRDWCIEKPKTPEEELRELLYLLWEENNRDFEMFLDVAVKHITKKPLLRL